MQRPPASTYLLGRRKTRCARARARQCMQTQRRAAREFAFYLRLGGHRHGHQTPMKGEIRSISAALRLIGGGGRLLARGYWEKWLHSQTVINGLFVWPTRRLALLIPNIKLLWERQKRARAPSQYACSEGRKLRYWWRILLQKQANYLNLLQSIYLSHRYGGGAKRGGKVHIKYNILTAAQRSNINWSEELREPASRRERV